MKFQEELTALLNKHSIENESDTPDWILANYIAGCLNAWNQSIHSRDKWYNFKPWGDNESIESTEVL